MEVEPDRVNVPVEDRVLLHLLENLSERDRHTVGHEVTRNGIAQACALHPPNVSRNEKSRSTGTCHFTH